MLLDIGMPEMDGYEVARRIRLQPGREDVMLVALTGWGQDAGLPRNRAPRASTTTSSSRRTSTSSATCSRARGMAR